MKCYILQGLLGIAVVAVLVGAVCLVIGALVLVGLGLENRCRRSNITVPRGVVTAAKYSVYTLGGAFILFSISAVVWMLGGDALHRLFHYCVG